MTSDTAATPRYIEVEQRVQQVTDRLSIDDPMIPEERLAPLGSPAVTRRSFRNMAIESFRALLHLTNISPGSRVLDVGSGVGRTAIPLTQLLTEGSYVGIDVMADLVTDSRARITTRHPNFEFQHVDVYSGMYNSAAEAQAKDLRFDFPDGHFDTIFLFSVFSHMFPEDVLPYLKEFHRLLRPGGIVLATFFLMTPRARKAIEDGKTKFQFAHTHRGVLVNSKELPEGAVAYPPDVLDGMVKASGLDHLHTSYGSWAGVQRALTGQDAVILQRR